MGFSMFGDFTAVKHLGKNYVPLLEISNVYFQTKGTKFSPTDKEKSTAF
jgi:hypothetical protein